jgi:hypothetical protein
MPHAVSGLARLGLVVLALCWAQNTPAQSNQVSLPAVLDATIYNPGGDDLADGQGEYIWTSVLASGVKRRALLKFDLSAIPLGATVTQARLEIYQSRARNGHNVSAHRLLASWGEGPSNGGSQGAGAPAEAGDVTWRHRFYPNTLWASYGGEFVATPSATILVGASSDWYSWISRPLSEGGPSPLLAADVQRWIDDPTQNHGWILIGDESVDQNAKRFQSTENGAAPPRLIVVFNPPVAAESDDVPLPGWALALLAAGLGLTLLGRRGRAP